MTYILVADPNDQKREKLAQVLNGIGYDVVHAAQEQTLLEQITSKNIELVCLSPSFSNLDYASLLNPAQRDMSHINTYLPILMIIDNLEEDYISGFLDMGADDFISSSFQVRLVETRVESVLGLRWSDNHTKSNISEYIEFAEDIQEYVLPMGFQFIHASTIEHLSELIVNTGQAIANADGATLYLRIDDELIFTYLKTTSLDIRMGGETGTKIPFEPIPLNHEDGSPNHQNISTHVALTGKLIHVQNVYDIEKFDFSATHEFDRQNNYTTRSCLTVPLKDNNDDVIAVLQLLNSKDAQGEIIPFKKNDILAIEGLGTQGAIAITNLLLLQERTKLIKFETDVQVGRTVQASFLPKSLPKLEDYQVAAEFLPAREVAGDFYDVFEIHPGTMAFVIADVCDKGVPAALYMALTRSLLRSFLLQRRKLSWAADALEKGGIFDKDNLNIGAMTDGLVRTNSYLVEHHAELIMFATMFFGILNTRTGSLAYINAGHNPPIILSSDGKKEFLEPTGPVVGIMADAKFGLEKTQLDPGDVLMMFTDGVPEARSPDGSFFTDEALEDLLQSDDELLEDIDGLLLNVKQTLMTFIDIAPQYDDITMLAVRRHKEK